MAKLFDIELTDIRRLRKWNKKAPKQFTRGAAGVLNDFAFGVKNKSNKVLNKKMVIRNSRFVSSSLRVQKTRGNDFNSLSSETGSIKRPRFSGWAEQELGKRSTRTKTATPFGRSGSKKGILKPSFRMKPGARFPKPSDFKGESPNKKVNTMLRTMRRKSSRPFIIKGSDRFKSGLYKFQNRKVIAIQRFKNRKQPKRVKWHTQAKAEYFRSVKPRDVWARNIRRILSSTLPR
jgi:hypothetical protein